MPAFDLITFRTRSCRPVMWSSKADCNGHHLSTGMFFELNLKKEFLETVSSVQMIVHAQDVRPRGNKQFPVVVKRNVFQVSFNGKNHSIRYDRFELAYNKFQNVLLPAPYATDWWVNLVK